MNPFQTYLQPSMENDQGPMTTEVEEKVEQDLNANAKDEAITSSVAEEATQLLNDQDVVLDNAIKTTEVVTESIASLEALYETLTTVSQERDTLTDFEVSMMRITLTGTAKSLNGTVAQIVPSLESDNYFERNDVNVSMESIGQAFKSGVSTFIKVVIDLAKKLGAWIKNVGTRIADKARLVRSKLRALNGDLEVDFPNQYFKPGMSAQDLLDGWVATDNAIEELVKLDFEKVLKTKHMLHEDFDFKDALNPYVTKIANAALKMRRIGYNFELESYQQYKITRNFEPKQGATTIVIPKRVFSTIDANLTDWIERQSALSKFIEVNEQIATSYQVQENQSQVIQDAMKMVKCGLTLGRTICQINAYIITAIHLAMTRNETGALSEAAKPTSKSNASTVTKAGGDARIVNLKQIGTSA